jgi:hypothetical protein
MNKHLFIKREERITVTEQLTKDSIHDFKNESQENS